MLQSSSLKYYDIKYDHKLISIIVVISMQAQREKKHISESELYEIVFLKGRTNKASI